MPVNPFILSVDFNIDRRKIAFEKRFLDKTDYCIGTNVVGTLKNRFFLNSNIIKNITLLNNKIKVISLSKTDETISVSNEIIQNSLRIINALPASVISYLQPENIYSTKLGTIIIDWEFDSNNILSLEIAKKSVGYFVEVNGQDYKEVTRISIENMSAILSSLTNDLSILL